MAYKVGDTVRHNYQFYGADTDTVASGYVLANLVGASLRLNGTTDKTSLLAMAEIGTTGEYVISYVADTAGHWSLNFTEPSGTLGYHQRAAVEVISATATENVITSLYDTVVSHIQDDVGVLATADVEEACVSAIYVFSVYSPNTITYSYTGDGTTKKIYISALTSWIEGLSEVTNVEYPSTDYPPTYLNENDDWWQARDATGKYIGWYSAVTSGLVAYVHYTGLHASDGSTLTAFDVKRVAFLAAGFALEKAACYWLQHSNSSLGDAIAEFRDRSDRAASRAREYMGLFYSFFGGDGKSLAATAPAFKRVEFDTKRESGYSRPLLTHGN